MVWAAGESGIEGISVSGTFRYTQNGQRGDQPFVDLAISACLHCSGAGEKGAHLPDDSSESLLVHLFAQTLNRLGTAVGRWVYVLGRLLFALVEG